MAIISTCSNHFKYQLASGECKFGGHSFRGALMTAAFAFNKDTHATWSDCVASEIAAGNGYTASGEILDGQTLTEDDANDRAQVAWSDETWTASGGDMAETGSMIVFDDTSTDDTVLGCIDFGTDYTNTNGNQLVISGITFRLT